MLSFVLFDKLSIECLYGIIKVNYRFYFSNFISIYISRAQQFKLVDLFESSTVVSMPASVLAVPSRQKTAEIMYSITNKT